MRFSTYDVELLRADIERYIDDYGVLDKLFDVDGGDSCNRVGAYVTLLKLIPQRIAKKLPMYKDQKLALKKFQPEPGYLIRHPDLDHWVSDWDRGSRDQLKAWLYGAACLNDSGQLLWSEFAAHFKKRLLLLCTNTKHNGVTKRNHGTVDHSGRRDYGNKLPDVCFFEIWAIYLRGLFGWWCYPFYWLLDIHIFGSALISRLQPKDDDVINNVLGVTYTNRVCPTIWTWLATKIHPPKIFIPKIQKYFLKYDPEGKKDMVFFVTLFKLAWKEEGYT